jgi:transcriptional regulator with XRE-family HTH domain
LRNRRLDPETFQALQVLMANGALRIGEGLGAAIAERRKELAISPATLAARLDLAPGDVAAMEDGGVELSASRLVQLADALGVDLVWFIEREPSFLAGRMQGGPFDIDATFPATEEGLELMRAFAAIADPQARKAVLDLALRFAQREPPNGDPSDD